MLIQSFSLSSRLSLVRCVSRRIDHRLALRNATMSTTTFKALLIEQDAENKKKTTSAIKDLSLDDLPPHGVLVRVAYSTLNCKDGLAVSGKGGRICRKLPMVGGIDLAGTVVETTASTTGGWKEGDRVLVNGHGLGETEWGGYAGFARMKPDWLVRIPETFSLEQSMAIGTAGYTSMLCVNAIRDHGISPEHGPVLVTGAAGGVGSIAVSLLSKLGYDVHASTGRPGVAEEYLKGHLGASTVLDRAELARDAKPLEKERWAAAVDTVGSQTLATVLAQTKYGGLVSACGLAGGMDLPTSVAPFILRGVTLRGIDSVMASREIRERAWSDLGKLLDPKLLDGIYAVEPMAKLPELAPAIVDGKIKGRVVIDIQGVSSNL